MKVKTKIIQAHRISNINVVMQCAYSLHPQKVHSLHSHNLGSNTEEGIEKGYGNFKFEPPGGTKKRKKNK